MEKVGVKGKGIMGDALKTVGSFVPFTYGKSLPEGLRNPYGRVPVYGSNGVVGYHDTSLTDGPTIVVGRKGTVGAVHFSPVPCWPIDTTFYVTDKDPALLRFKYYILKSLGLEYMNEDSAVPGLNREAAHARKIRVPDISEQRTIANILGTLDDKIELNRRMNETLEAMAQALFKSWFIDFLPVREKQCARTQTGDPGLPKEISLPAPPSKASRQAGDLFPDSFENSELGEIPIEWSIRKLGDIGKIQPGYAFKSQDFVNEGIKVIKIKNIQNSVVDIFEGDYVSENIFKKIDIKFNLSSGEVLMAMTGAELGKVGMIPKINYKMLLNQRVGKVVSNNTFFCYLLLKQDYIQSYMKGISSASSAQGNISNADIEDIEIVLPDKRVINMFTEITFPFYRQMFYNLGENIKLSHIIDLLLPKLISGGICVRNIIERKLNN